MNCLRRPRKSVEQQQQQHSGLIPIIWCVFVAMICSVAFTSKYQSLDSVCEDSPCLMPTPQTATTTTTIQHIGHSKTPIIIVDNLLPKTTYQFLRNKFRNRTHFYKEHNDGFPGLLSLLQKGFVEQISNSLISNTHVKRFYPSRVFARMDKIRGFVTVLCDVSEIHADDDDAWEEMTGNDVERLKQHASTTLYSPAAVFYFGFDGATTSSTTAGAPRIHPSTGTSFYRERTSGVERVSQILRNTESHCVSYPMSPSNLCGKESKDQSEYELYHKVYSQPNRMVLYPRDLLHRGWVEDDNTGNKKYLPCNANEGRLAISLFFWSGEKDQVPKIVNETIDGESNVWSPEY